MAGALHVTGIERLAGGGRVWPADKKFFRDHRNEPAAAGANRRLAAAPSAAGRRHRRQ